MSDDERTRLAVNLKDQREARGLTQQELSDRSGVPRPTLAHLESGQGNPTLSVLIKVAAALGTGIEALVSASRPKVRVVTRADVPTEARGGVELRSLGMDLGIGFERWELQRGAKVERGAGRNGERRVVVCESGELSITVGPTEHRLRAGEVAVIDAAARPAFESRGRGISVVYSACG
ncbi:MAG TPA: helix-turn-helix domain-containing protein [Polyangiaceae bacterium]|nr:helix-turn-helix domain-containing protein [Polyangiaceae bacterium]